ncbi:hypothetical protein GCM10027271_31180 [Saccharopolyspora gloriosae]|nr:STAS/SEC14 domain-containing protein [Saccharopolyspora gloriosae]
MLETVREVPHGIDAIRASGTVTKEDYQRVVEPLLDAARRENRRIRLLYQAGPELHGFSPAAMWEDTKVGLASLRLFEGCAVVTDIGWIRDLSRLGAFLVSCPVRVFNGDEWEKAVAWLNGLPEGPGVAHRLDADSGVLVIDVRQPLRVQDFDALAVTVDAWIEQHNDLRGLVVHARAFPGWQNLPSLIRHVRFVHDHHRKIERVALAADSVLGDIVPHLAKHFVHAEVAKFDYQDLDKAVSWTTGAPATR